MERGDIEEVELADDREVITRSGVPEHTLDIPVVEPDDGEAEGCVVLRQSRACDEHEGAEEHACKSFKHGHTIPDAGVLRARVNEFAAVASESGSRLDRCAGK